MSRSNPRPSEDQKRRRAERQAAEMLALRNEQLRVAERARAFHDSLRVGGDAAYTHWHAHRAQLVRDGTLAPDVVVTPLAWVPRWPTPPLPEPLPPTPTAVEAARVAAEMLAQRPRMTREDHVALGTLIARLRLLYQELGWEE